MSALLESGWRVPVQAMELQEKQVLVPALVVVL